MHKQRLDEEWRQVEKVKLKRDFEEAYFNNLITPLYHNGMISMDEYEQARMAVVRIKNLYESLYLRVVNKASSKPSRSCR